MDPKYEKYSAMAKRYTVLFFIAFVPILLLFFAVGQYIGVHHLGMVLFWLIIFSQFFIASMLFGIFSYLKFKKLIAPFAVLLAALLLATAIYAWICSLAGARDAVTVFLFSLDFAILALISPVAAIITKAIRAVMKMD